MSWSGLSWFAKAILSPQNHVYFCVILLFPWLRGWRPRIWRYLGPASLVWILILFSPLGSWALYHYERQIPLPPVSSLAGHTALVLTGDTGLYYLPAGQMVWMANAARVQEPLRLYHQGVLKKLVVTGSRAFGISREYRDEALSVGQWWREMGVPESAIVIEPNALNTHQNFTLSQPLLSALSPHEKVVLITSAFHLPRALGVARKIGLEVIPYPVDFKVRGDFDWFSWENLLNFERVLFELLGHLSYIILRYAD